MGFFFLNNFNVIIGKNIFSEQYLVFGYLKLIELQEFGLRGHDIPQGSQPAPLQRAHLPADGYLRGLHLGALPLSEGLGQRRPLRYVGVERELRNEISGKPINN